MEGMEASCESAEAGFEGRRGDGAGPRASGGSVNIAAQAPRCGSFCRIWLAQGIACAHTTT